MRILYAEDSPIYQTLLREVLGKWGYEVTSTENGIEALEILNGPEGPHLAILDWAMPGLDGIEICRRLRSSHRAYYIYLILLTANDNLQDLVAGMEAGADDYLIKPVNFPALRLRLLAATRVLSFEERFRSLFADAPVAYHEINDAGVVVRVNQAECNLLGYTAAEMVGRPIWDFVTRNQHEESHHAVAEKMRGEADLQTFERDYLRRDGSKVTLEIHENHIRNEAGRVVGIRSALVDITSRKQHEQEAARHTAELARSNAELEQFAYVASHDLQEPLRMVSSYTQLLARRYKGKLGQDADEFIGFAVDGASRMQHLINDLLALSRVGTRGAEFHSTDAERSLADSLLDLQPAIAGKAAEVTHEPLPTIWADAGQFRQVLQNLIGNAVKFCNGQQPRVHVSGRDNGGEWQFSVKDNGIGIDPVYSDRIFQIFQRLHTAKEYPGTGIGLAICKKIVDRHGGRIWFDSEPGRGTTFHFTIPKPASGRGADVQAEKALRLEPRT